MLSPKSTIKSALSVQDHDVPCPLCESHNDTVIAKKGYPGVPLTNVICKTCGLIRINPRMSDKGYEDFYRSEFFDYLNPYARPAYVEEIERTTDPTCETPTKKMIMPFIRNYVPVGGRVLDVGAGFGQVLYLLKKEKNITGIGLEPDPFSRNIAKEKMGIDMLPDLVETYLAKNSGKPDAKVDFIVLNQTFEHLMYPLETLKGLAKILKPEGVIYIGVPNAYNPFIPIKLFYQFAHTYNYTPHTMKLFAEKAGLKVIEIKDPLGYPLEVLLAHKNSSYRAEKPERLTQGSSWKDTYRRLRRKKFLNISRGGIKTILGAVIGKNLTEKAKRLIDRTIHYRY